MGQAGGAATSGRGLTAVQVAAALKEVAASHLRCAEAASGPSPRLGRTGGSLAACCSTINQEDCAAMRPFTVSSVDVNGNMVDLHVKEYAPKVFSLVRQVEGVTDAQFAGEWSLPEERLKLELGEGRSQALFLKSKGMAFMCKTIAEEEVEALLRVLRAYAQHIATQPNSLLMRFYMLLQLSAGKEVGYIVCFNDIFRAATVLHEKWDIKGRLPKPGKYQYYPHLIRSAYEPDPYLIETPTNRDVLVSTDAVDSRDSLPVREDVVVVKGAEDTQKLTTLHDKDLTRLFWLPLHRRKLLIQQLLGDYEFLRKAGHMDYSLLIGVAYQENKVSRSGKRYVIENMKMTSPPGTTTSTPRIEVRPSANITRDADAASDGVCCAKSEFAVGMHSLYDQEIYYIGIIDMLTTYTVKKKTANFFKSILWEERTLSTIPPAMYAQRIASFTKLIFPEVHDGSNGSV